MLGGLETRRPEGRITSKLFLLHFLGTFPSCSYKLLAVPLHLSFSSIPIFLLSFYRLPSLIPLLRAFLADCSPFLSSPLSITFSAILSSQITATRILQELSEYCKTIVTSHLKVPSRFLVLFGPFFFQLPLRSRSS